MSSVFHLGSIRRLVEAKPIRAVRGERQGIELPRCRMEKALPLVYSTAGRGATTTVQPQVESITAESCFFIISDYIRHQKLPST